METLVDLYTSIRARYPALAARADEEHLRRWGEISPALAPAWFENLAASVNASMQSGTPEASHVSLFKDLANAFRSGRPDVRTCIDVSFVENLFWEVPTDKVPQYWCSLPPILQDLYVSFHKRAPL